MKKIVLAVLAVFSLSACAFSDVNLSLEDQTFDLNSSATNATAIDLVSFTDTRQNQANIGNVRNGLHAQTAEVLTESDSALWVKNSLISSLRKAGFKVSDLQARDTAEPNATKLTTNLFRLHADMSVRGLSVVHTGNIELMLTAEKNGQKQQQTLRGAGESSSISISKSSYQAALSGALGDLVQNVAAWLRTLK